MALISFQYASLEEALAVIQPVDEKHEVSSTQSLVAFFGRRIKNRAESLRLLTEYWEEGMRYLEEARQELEVALESVGTVERRTEYNDEDGDELDLDRLRNGQAYWRRSARKRVEGKGVVTVALNMTTHCSVGSRGITTRAACAIILAEQLEQLGYKVQIVAYDASRTKSETNLVSVISLKEAGQPIDPSNLINVTSSWAYRTSWFSMIEANVRIAGEKIEHCLPLGSISKEELRELTKADNLIIVNQTNVRDCAEQIRRELGALSTREVFN